MVFEITPENIEALSDADLRTLVGRLASKKSFGQAIRHQV